MPTLTQAVGVRDVGERPLAEWPRAAFAGRFALLVLDNVERVVTAAPSVAAALAACPDIKALVTSRARLRVSGEHADRVPPLGLHEEEAHPLVADPLPAPAAGFGAAARPRLPGDRAETGRPLAGPADGPPLRGCTARPGRQAGRLVRHPPPRHAPSRPGGTTPVAVLNHRLTP